MLLVLPRQARGGPARSALMFREASTKWPGRDGISSAETGGRCPSSFLKSSALGLPKYARPGGQSDDPFGGGRRRSQRGHREQETAMAEPYRPDHEVAVVS
jgi:hypothetical protein